jgi:hypothetical protein
MTLANYFNIPHLMRHRSKQLQWYQPQIVVTLSVIDMFTPSRERLVQQ